MLEEIILGVLSWCVVIPSALCSMMTVLILKMAFIQGVQHTIAAEAAAQPEAEFVVYPELDHATPVLVPVPASSSQGKV